MRLSTAPDRDEERSIAVLHALLDAGVTLLDTADAYAWDADETGHNERLIARALAGWAGDRDRVLVATKGGLTRPAGHWVPDGRARHLAAACEASCRALDRARLPLYQLHVVDPRVPISTSVRALDRLRRAGLVERIGLCNVTVGQIEQARRITEISSVQVEVSVWQEASLLSGVVEHCVACGIRLLAHRPLGGPERRRRLESDPALRAVADRLDATPAEIALAWLADLSPHLVALPGPTRVETVTSIARAARLVLTDADREQLDARSVAVPALRAQSDAASRAVRRPGRAGEIVLVMGLPAAGKSTVARELMAEGYARLNRDESGGTLRTLVPALGRLVADGITRIVLDNTYVSRQARRPVLEAAAGLGLDVRGIWLATSIEDAQVNAVHRMLARYGHLLDAEELRRSARDDPSVFGPLVQFRYQRALEPPDETEGFTRLENRPFVRKPRPRGGARGIVVWLDDTLWSSRAGHRAPRGAGDVAIDEPRAARLRQYAERGFVLVGLSWLPEIGDGVLTRSEADAAASRVEALVGRPIDVAYCPHRAGPPECWCRKPLPGLGVLMIERHGLDPIESTYVAAGPQDPAFARRLGFRFADAEMFFKTAPPVT
jgi:aryl-alcohol dehydrogenase-like predicted oxidoreductase/predicted kinase